MKHISIVLLLFLVVIVGVYAQQDQIAQLLEQDQDTITTDSGASIPVGQVVELQKGRYELSSGMTIFADKETLAKNVGNNKLQVPITGHMHTIGKTTEVSRTIVGIHRKESISIYDGTIDGQSFSNVNVISDGKKLTGLIQASQSTIAGISFTDLNLNGLLPASAQVPFTYDPKKGTTILFKEKKYVGFSSLFSDDEEFSIQLAAGDVTIDRNRKLFGISLTLPPGGKATVTNGDFDFLVDADGPPKLPKRTSGFSFFSRRNDQSSGSLLQTFYIEIIDKNSGAKKTYRFQNRPGGGVDVFDSRNVPSTSSEPEQPRFSLSKMIYGSKPN